MLDVEVLDLAWVAFTKGTENHMKIIKMGMAGLLAVGAIAALSPAASARSMGAWAGKPLDGTALSCYAENAGTVQGVNCPTARWEVNLPVDSSGPFTVQFSSKGSAAGGVPCCNAYTTDQNGAMLASATEICSGTTMGNHVLSALTVPNGGQLFLACRGLTDSAKRVGVVNW